MDGFAADGASSEKLFGGRLQSDAVDILLVEDNLGDARLIRELLKDAPECDWRVVHVDAFAAALDLLTSKDFDICLLDLNLPDSAATTTLEQLSQFFRLPIIVLTGTDDAETGLAALRQGAQDYLVKGKVDGQGLARAVRYAVERFALEQRYGQMFAASNDAIFVLEPAADIIIDVNPKALVMLGYSRGELLALPASQLSGEAELWQAYLAKVSRGAASAAAELSFRAKSGRDVHVDVSAASIKQDGAVCVVLTARDVTEKRYLLKELEHQANHDALTGLYNRYALERHFKQAAQRNVRKLPSLSLISLDLEDFKRVNDSLGHVAGDELLEQVAKRLSRVAGPKDFLARTGGDEFTLLFVKTRGRSAEMLAERILHSFGAPFTVAGNKLHMRASLGVATLEESARDFRELMRRTDQAMYQAKRGGGGVVFFDEATDALLQEQLWLERALREALSDRTLSLHFQPLVPLKKETRPLAEALLRWQHPERGPIDAERVVTVAEATGLMRSLDAWAIGEAVSKAAAGGFSVSVNVSPSSLRVPDFAELVAERLAEAGLGASRLTLEVTEGILASPQWALASLAALNDLGVNIVIDDFGTGYSSLEYLFRFSLNGLKVDRAFTAKLIEDERAEIISRTVVQLATNLGIKAVVEGVETEAQLDWARAAGASHVQGFLTGEPMSYADFMAWCDAAEVLV